MALSNRQQRYLKKKADKFSLKKIAAHLNVSVADLLPYVDQKLAKFSLSKWLKKSWSTLILILIAGIGVYINGLNNEFLSDDIAAIPESTTLDSFKYVWSYPPVILRPFFYFVINQVFGRIPIAYRLLNLSFHLGSGLLIYLIVYLLTSNLPALIASLLFMVHPLQTEAVTWISGGPYAQYTFFLLLSLALYILAQRQKDKKLYITSVVGFLFALMSSEKALAFPLILLTFVISFEQLKTVWKKLIPYFLLGGAWVVIYATRIGQRVTELAEKHYQAPTRLNPLYQIPVALSSYLRLLFWPDKLSLYHTELHFSEAEFGLRFILVLAFLLLIGLSFKRYRKIFFWLSFFVLALSPTLTPFGISWIVAERYAYPAAIGIYVSLALVLESIVKKTKSLAPIWVGLFIILGLLSWRTVKRNIDWKNQDNLWLAAARTSPSSAQNHNNLGDYYARHGDLQKALEEFQLAIDLLPGYADAYHNKANVYQQMGKPEKAAEHYQKALEFNPQLWQSHQNLAGLYWQAGQKDKSLEHLKKAVEINPDNQNLQNLLRQLSGQ